MRAFHALAVGAVMVAGAAMAQTAQDQAQPAEILSTPQPLANIAVLPPRIASANVRDSSGAIVGAVQRVELAGNGTAARVDVALLGKRDHIVSLDPSQLTYDAANNEIVAQSSAAQMRAMPNRS